MASRAGEGGAVWFWMVRSDPGEEQAAKGIREDCPATWLSVSGFIVIELVSRLSLANHSDSGSFLVVLTSLSQDGFQPEGFWEVVGHMASPLDLY